MSAEGHPRREHSLPFWARALAFGVVASVAVSGCTKAASSANSHPTPVAATAKSQSPNNYPSVDIGTLPQELPAGVAHALGSVVSMEFNYAKGKLDDVGSGIRVARDTYLGPGHLVRNPNNTLRPGVGYCGNLAAFGPSTTASVGVQSGSSTIPLYGTTLNAVRFASSYFDGGDYKRVVPDALLMQAPDVDDTLPGQPVATLSASAIAIGQKVFFGNYQPTNSNQYRSPSEIEADSLSDFSLKPSALPRLTKPAVFGGVVIKRLSNGNFVVADGLMSYDNEGDTQLEGGGSGGGVFNTAGQLIATSIQGGAIAKPHAGDIADLDAVEGLNLRGEAASAAVGTAVIQPFDRQIEEQLQRMLDDAHLCTATAGNNP